MPSLTGKELAKKIMRIRPDIPIILCSGYSASIDEKTAIDMGIQAFVNKPFQKNELAAVVRRVLDTHHAGEQWTSQPVVKAQLN